MKSSDNFAALPGDGEVAGKLSGINSCLVVLCAGKGTRTGLGYNKMFYYSGHSDVLSLTLIAADNSAASSIVVVCRSASVTASYQRLERDFLRLAGKNGLLRERSASK